MNRTAKSILVFFVATFCVALLLLYLPVNRVWFALLVAVIGTILYYWHDPAHRFGRLAVYCVSVAGASAAWPGLNAWLELEGIAEGQVALGDVSPMIPITFLITGGFLGVLQVAVTRQNEHDKRERPSRN